MNINDMVCRSHEIASEHGFWDDWARVLDLYDNVQDDDIIFPKAMELNAINSRLALIASEVGEATESLRHEDMDSFSEEMADIVIRVADLCGGIGIDLEYEIEKKMQRNREREYKHGKSM